MLTHYGFCLSHTIHQILYPRFCYFILINVVSLGMFGWAKILLPNRKHIAMEADEDAQEPNFPIMELDNAESGIQDANEAIIAVDDGETSAIIYSDLEETSSNPLQSTEDQIVVQSEMERDEPPSVSPQLTSGSTSEILDSPLSSDSHSEEGNIMIVIPQIQLQGDYHTYDVDPCVLEIIRETRSSNSPQYTVATRDGSDMMVGVPVLHHSF